MSGEGSSHRPHTPAHRSLLSPELSRPVVERVDSVQPHESASHNGDDSRSASPDLPPMEMEDSPFPFKFKAPTGRVHRLQVLASTGLEDLVSRVTAKLGGEVDAVGGKAVVEDGKLTPSGFALSYLDNDGDTVSITTDQDLLDAITLSRQSHREKVDLFVHDPEKPPMSATVDPRPSVAKPLTPPSSTMKSRRRLVDGDDEDDMATPVKKDRKQKARSQETNQLIAGVPNDLLLPGAIVTLSVVIIGVFAMSRSNK